MRDIFFSPRTSAGESPRERPLGLLSARAPMPRGAPIPLNPPDILISQPY
jgi:hypothetical protein